MAKSKLKTNIVLQTTFQVFSLIVPFITAPYISRVLGSENVGIYSYNYSIINYFMIIQMLGLENYGNRSIARTKGKNEDINGLFSEIFLAHIMVSVVVLIGYACYLSTLSGSALTIGIIQSMYLIGQTFNVSWVYAGLGEFKITVIRSIILKVLSLISVFVFVKTNNDLLIYILILALDVLFGSLILWVPLRKYVKLIKVSLKSALKHIKPMSVLFVAIIASSIYRMMDKTMLGAMGSLSNLGCYEYADKIVRMPLSVITGLGLVMLSKTANMYGSGENKKVVVLTENTLFYVTIFSSLMIFGFLSFGNMFSVLYLGDGYVYTGLLLMILSPTLLFCAWNNVFRTQFYIPQSFDKTYVIATIAGAALNVVLNLILIPQWDCIGAAIATDASYFLVFLILIFFARKNFHMLRIIGKNFLCLIIGVVPFIVSYFIKDKLPENWWSMILQIVIFCVIFAALCLPILHKKGVLSNLLKKRGSNG